MEFKIRLAAEVFTRTSGEQTVRQRFDFVRLQRRGGLEMYSLLTSSRPGRVPR